jgi:hypothetical protein
MQKVVLRRLPTGGMGFTVTGLTLCFASKPIAAIAYIGDHFTLLGGRENGRLLIVKLAPKKLSSKQASFFFPLI